MQDHAGAVAATSRAASSKGRKSKSGFGAFSHSISGTASISAALMPLPLRGTYRAFTTHRRLATCGGLTAMRPRRAFPTRPRGPGPPSL
jgi:hypothetical protein